MLSAIIEEAEGRAANGIESVRQSVVLKIQSNRTFNGVLGKSLRSSIGSIVKESFNGFAVLFTPYINRAWDDGIKRGNPNNSAISVTHNTESLIEGVASGFSHLSESIRDGINSVLIRASLNEWNRSDVIDKVGDSEETGLFKSFAARGRGIVDHALQTAESMGYALASREAANILAQQHSYSNAKKIISQGKHPLTIKYWSHSHGGNPPRSNHLEFDLHGVPVDMNFKLPPDGNGDGPWHCEGPHAASLPAGQVINCHCAAITVVLYVTVEEEKEIRSRALETGGYLDSRWGG